MSEAQPLATRQVLHVDFVSLREDLGPFVRDQVIGGTAALWELPGLHACCVIEGAPGSDFDLAVCFVLPEFSALEPFGTDPRYIRFLQGVLAPRLRAFAGCDVALDANFPAIDTEFAACLAIALPDETYDWEARAKLTDWLATARDEASVIGLAIGERQRYRGLALAFTDEPPTPTRPPATDSSVVAGRLRRIV